jgi:hypothetical protein
LHLDSAGIDWWIPTPGRTPATRERRTRLQLPVAVVMGAAG